MERLVQQDRIALRRGLVLCALLVATVRADPPLAPPKPALLTGDYGTAPVAADPPPARIKESQHVAGRIDAFELAPGTHRVTVDYEELDKRKVAGFESRDTYTPPFADAKPHSRCALTFDFEAGKTYRVVRRSISKRGALKLFFTDGWGVWLIEAGGDRPLAQCI